MVLADNHERMKLYAEVQSDRARKGQGGNQFIHVKLTSGSAKAPKLEYEVSYTKEGLHVYKDKTTLLDTRNHHDDQQRLN